MNSIIIKAPAKVNLFLDVINKRPDGYHNIATVFERIDLYDWMKISVIPKGIRILCEQDKLRTPGNTAYKATELLCQRYNLKCGFKIQIDKRIPIAAGLGGGSSDAASVLLGINNLLGLGIKNAILSKLAANIGADVPFFVSGYSRAFATGIGEKLTPLKQRQKIFFLLVNPNIEILTYNIYNRLNASTSLSINPVLRQAQHGSKHGEQGRTKRSQRVNLPLTKENSGANIFRHYLQQLPPESIKNILYNKLEEVVLPSYPVLHYIKRALRRTGAEGVLVSGSGSTVYGIFSSRKEAVRAQDELRQGGNWQLFLVSNY